MPRIRQAQERFARVEIGIAEMLNAIAGVDRFLAGPTEKSS
jgi:hypothetical protein